MADLDAPDMLSRLTTELKRPTNSADMDTTVLYRDLTTGLRYVQALLFKHGFEHNAIWELATTSDEITYSIVYEPAGEPICRDGRTGPQLVLGPDNDPATDLVWMGQTFLVPENQTRTFGDGLYVRYTPEHVTIAADVPPTLKPTEARVLAVYRAAEIFLDRGGYRDASVFGNKLHKAAFGDPTMPGDQGIINSRKGPRSAPSGRTPGPWWRGSFIRP